MNWGRDLETHHRPIMSCRGHDDRRSDDVRVHAGLRVVIERDERPVRYDAGDSLLSGEVVADDQVFDGGSVHEDDVWHGEDLRQDCGGEECGVLDDDEGTFVFEGDTEFGEEAVGRLAYDLSIDTK